MNIILTGATGMVGREVLREAVLDDEIKQITVLTRKPLSVENDKIKALILEDFLDYSNVTADLKDHDACIWCLGLSQKGVSEAEYEKVTHDYALAAAKAMWAENPGLTFCFLSGMGADSKEKSKVLFARVKGKTENSLSRLGLQVFNFRPGYIYPVRKREKPRLEERLLEPIVPLYRQIAPSYIINSDELAKVLIEVAKNGYKSTILEGKDIRNVANSLSKPD